MKPRFFAKSGGIKPSERQVIRKGVQRLDHAIRDRNVKAIQYGRVLEVGLAAFFKALINPDKVEAWELPDWNNASDRHRIQVAVERVFDHWVNNPPVTYWTWLKNRGRFTYSLEWSNDLGQVMFQSGEVTAMFCSGEINDLGEPISQLDLQRWDREHEENKYVSTSKADGGGLPGT
jgi:hypothetical protein